MQADIGFADVVTPGPVPLVYPVMLEFPAPALTGYTPETVVAEKFEAMVRLGELNSRMKDFYDRRAERGPARVRGLEATNKEGSR